LSELRAEGNLMESLKVLLERKLELDRQINEARNVEKSAAILLIQKLMTEHKITFEDIRGEVRVPKPKRIIPVKYREPGTENTWTGRGMTPRWLKAAYAKGRTLEEFEIVDEK
jgi:DNA-binding protein H-NS